jgi:short-subunit dehydrogenase
MDLALKGKTALVTGASRGIGVYIAKTLAAHGCNLALAARNTEQLEETRRTCERMGVRAVALGCDVGSVDDLRGLVAATEREFGRVDVVVNNAGIEYTERFHYLSVDQIEELIRVNLTSSLWLSKLVLPAMLERNSGSIVNVASLAGKGPTPFNALYSASKHGMVGFTNSLIAELDGTGVVCGVVCPGFVDAGMWTTHQQHGAKLPPMMRAVDPQKVADAVVKAAVKGGEYIVAGAPYRPLLALGELAPGLMKPIVRRLGVNKVFSAGADRERLGKDRPPADEPARERVDTAS